MLEMMQQRIRGAKNRGKVKEPDHSGSALKSFRKIEFLRPNSQYNTSCLLLEYYIPLSSMDYKVIETYPS